MLQRILFAIESILYGGILIALLSTSGATPSRGARDDVHRFTRAIEFDYLDWTLDALASKLGQAAIGTPFYFDEPSRHQVVLDYLQVMDEILGKERYLEWIYTDPAVSDPGQASAELRADLAVLYTRQGQLAPLAESILQQQVTAVLTDIGLAPAGQPLPPVSFHISPLPWHLVISPRDRIQQETAVSLLPDLAIDRIDALEEQVDAALDVSSLVVPIGGLGSYPTMIMRTTDLGWLADTIAHEWIHNWLTFHPLGLNYNASPELRTMNETTASIAGAEIASLVLERYYPELLTDSGSKAIAIPFDPIGPGELPRPTFDFRKEMHITRIHVDELLAAGDIDAAETYMEERRQFFWENGYAIRKLNQAYFAFYGAYADVPGGPAGQDPVGPAVRALRARSASLADFLKTMAGMNSFEDLQKVLAR